MRLGRPGLRVRQITPTGHPDPPLTLWGQICIEGIPDLKNLAALAMGPPPRNKRQVTLVYTPTKSGRFQSMLRFTSSDGKESDDIEIPTYGTALN